MFVPQIFHIHTNSPTKVSLILLYQIRSRKTRRTDCVHISHREGWKKLKNLLTKLYLRNKAHEIYVHLLDYYTLQICAWVLLFRMKSLVYLRASEIHLDDPENGYNKLLRNVSVFIHESVQWYIPEGVNIHQHKCCDHKPLISNTASQRAAGCIPRLSTALQVWHTEHRHRHRHRHRHPFDRGPHMIPSQDKDNF